MCPPDRCPLNPDDRGLVTAIIPGQAGTYRHLRGRVAQLLADSGLTITSGTEYVYVADVDLPAYHQLTQDDLRLVGVDRRRVPADAVRERDRDTLLDRYTTTNLRQSQPVQLSQLGPRLPAGAIGSFVVALPSTPETTVGGRLARGDRVDVLLSANELVQSAATRLTGVLVLDVVDGPDASVVVAVAPRGVDELAARRGSSMVIVVRTRAYGF